MSSGDLENAGWSPRNASERILAVLKMSGAETSARLGEKLGITGEAARQQLVRLADQGLVAATSEAKGVGRPKQLWHLTEAAQARFPDTHANLTAQLFRIVRDEFGEAALDRIITIREAETRAAYESKLADKNDLADRVAALARLRSEEGYMAEWRRQPDGSILFAENHCPICMAATACQRFCRAELEVFRAVLGPSVEIERTEHIVKGGRRCTYVIREKGT